MKPSTLSLLVLSSAICVAVFFGVSFWPPTQSNATRGSADSTSSTSDPGPSSHARMIDYLESLYDSQDYYRVQTTPGAWKETLPARLVEVTGGVRGIQLRLQAAKEALRSGATEECLRLLKEAEDGAEKLGLLRAPETRTDLDRFYSWVYLRWAEDENCVALHNADSCLFPIQGQGVHTNTTGATKAVEYLKRVLEKEPTDVGSKWLLNLSYQTLGLYPQEVPERFLIEPSVFESGTSLGRFENIAATASCDVKGLSGGVCLEDFNNDGVLDLMVSAWGVREQLRLLIGDGKGGFRDETEAAGLLGEFGGLNLCHADYNNDGFVDVLVLRGAWLADRGRHPNSLLKNNGDGTFTDVTTSAGVLSFYPTQTAAWADFDQDGWLDLFVGNESVQSHVHPPELYRNNRDGTFSEISVKAGVWPPGLIKGVACADYDDDGRMDLYLSRHGQPNILYRNVTKSNGTIRFKNVTQGSGLERPINSFPTWFWDYDNDGDQDLFVASFPGYEGDNLEGIASHYLNGQSKLTRCRLYRNVGRGKFEDVSQAMGMDHPMLAMGANYGDLDNDGYLDLYVGTGEPSLRVLVPNRMYRNVGGRRFENVTFSTHTGHLQKGHGVAFGDFDSDGDQDVYAVMGGSYATDTAHNVLFENPGTPHRWLTLRLVGTKSNRSAIGARIEVRTVLADGSPKTFHSTVSTGGSFGASSLQQEMGLGTAATVKEIVVRWPDRERTRQKFTDIELDRVYELTEGQPAAKRLP